MLAALGRFPDVTTNCLLELCMGLAPFLRMTSSNYVETGLRDEKSRVRLVGSDAHVHT